MTQEPKNSQLPWVIAKDPRGEEIYFGTMNGTTVGRCSKEEDAALIVSSVNRSVAEVTTKDRFDEVADQITSRAIGRFPHSQIVCMKMEIVKALLATSDFAIAAERDRCSFILIDALTKIHKLQSGAVRSEAEIERMIRARGEAGK